MLELPVTRATRIVLVGPHYPENVGAAARAAKTMGITRLSLVRPGRLAIPEHENAYKMAVRAWDVLALAAVVDSLEEALPPGGVVFGTSGKRGLSGHLDPRSAAAKSTQLAARGIPISFLFGNEKTGLRDSESAHCDHFVRIPMAADQPSINLAQAVQIIAYELFLAGLSARERSPQS